MSQKAMSYHDAMDHNARLHKSRGSAKVLSEINLKEGENGGHIVEHRFSNSMQPTYHEPESFPFGKTDGHALVKHLIEHANIKGVKVTKADSDDEGGQDK